MKSLISKEFRFFFFLFTVLWGSCHLLFAKSVYPEMYGAVGDGIHDDAPAISECLQSGCPIALSSHKEYLLKSPIKAATGKGLLINGHGAKITIGKDFPLERYSSIFRFDKYNEEYESFEIKNLVIDCLLEQKFAEKADSTGDTYIFFTNKCQQTSISNVKFTCTGKFNNVTFLRCNSGNVSMDKCDIVLNTDSKQGGILWFMNRYSKRCNINIKNSNFEYDTNDECMCFSSYKIMEVPKCSIDVNVNNCIFRSNGTCRSSGFIIAYAHCLEAYSDIKICYCKTSFISKGNHFRHIQTYQSGNKSDHVFGSYLTTFDRCKFNFEMDKDSDSDKERGLLGLLRVSTNAIDINQIGYSFNNCTFRMREIYPIIGDKNGDEKGFYEFHKCKVDADNRAFQKKYSVGHNNIRLTLYKCNIKSSDEKQNTHVSWIK